MYRQTFFANKILYIIWMKFNLNKITDLATEGAIMLLFIYLFI